MTHVAHLTVPAQVIASQYDVEETYFAAEPQSGVLSKLVYSSQMNLQVGPTTMGAAGTFFKDIGTTLMPVFWISEQVSSLLRICVCVRALIGPLLVV